MGGGAQRQKLLSQNLNSKLDYPDAKIHGILFTVSYQLQKRREMGKGDPLGDSRIDLY